MTSQNPFFSHEKRPSWLKNPRILVAKEFLLNSKKRVLLRTLTLEQHPKSPSDFTKSLVFPREKALLTGKPRYCTKKVLLNSKKRVLLRTARTTPKKSSGLHKTPCFPTRKGPLDWKNPEYWSKKVLLNSKKRYFCEPWRSNNTQKVLRTSQNPVTSQADVIRDQSPNSSWKRRYLNQKFEKVLKKWPKMTIY